QPTESRVEFDQHEAQGIYPLGDESFGDGTSAGAELDHRARYVGVDVGCHGAGEGPAGRRDRAHRQWLLEPRADEAHVVVQGFDSLLDLLSLMLDPSLEFVLPALEPLYMPLDLSLQRAFAQFENALLLFEFLLEDLESGKRHFALTLRSGRRWRDTIGKTHQ